ncbi:MULTISPECIES: GNAT family N-acetyltransferase [unclassified Streptomyces]|uniref:GNAT family N-acetyltransferase n=1 Tax=unclassified Streptomyces TaxID=2593676 RepID=UPI00224C8F42|nr:MULTISPECIES: GNAT family N-acetyltransferase [unclassified Streptomyces]MCX4526820.1 GNAT family N-acetyltransferase [Streptomyces sp. NBC_01551]MCX4542619.1 GNAT family N-acetyltransferase [Streptomyces sp. NBC_01565]
MTPPHLTDLPIRALTPEDLRHCADLSQDRGWPREEHKWGLLIAAGDGYGIDAPDGQGLAAACVVTRYGHDHTAPDLAAIGMVLVADRYARQGLGRRLMTHVCDDVLKGTPLTLHATPYGRPLYEELGFDTTGRAEMLQGAFSPDPATTGPARDAVQVRSATAEDLPRILRLDAEVFGSDRTHMITRLPAFADRLVVAEDPAGDLIGYAALWPNMETHVLGPLIARDTAGARALVTALATTTERPLRTDVDVRHEELLGWLKDRGLGSVAFNAVMTRGIPGLPGDWTRRWAPITVAAG